MPKKKGRPPETAPERRPDEPQQLTKQTKLEDDASVRRKSSGHKKSTADKWNQ